MERFLQDERIIIFYPHSKLYSSLTIKICKITLLEDYLRIEFVQYANREFVNGGYASIQPSIFIRPQGTLLKLPLIKAFGIPLAPQKQYFKSKDDKLFFTLCFPAINLSTQCIDIIEKEGGNGSYFNFYGVAMQTVLKGSIIKGIQYSAFDN